MLFTENRCFTSENEPEQHERRGLWEQQPVAVAALEAALVPGRALVSGGSAAADGQSPWMDRAGSIARGRSACLLGWLWNSDLFLIRVTLGLTCRFESCWLRMGIGHGLSPKGCGGRAPGTVRSGRATRRFAIPWERCGVRAKVHPRWAVSWVRVAAAPGARTPTAGSGRGTGDAQPPAQGLCTESGILASPLRRPRCISSRLRCCCYVACCYLVLPEPLYLFCAFGPLHAQKVGVCCVEPLLPVLY